VQKVEKLKALCLQYATSIQLLIPSIEVTNPDNTSKPSKSRSRINKSQEKDQQLKLVSENVVMSESILYVSHIALYLSNVKIRVPAQYLNCPIFCRKFEAAFNSELESLVPTLSNSSQAEPYLTHLAQCILGMRMDQ
jgi:gamma-tubulin complex component 2